MQNTDYGLQAAEAEHQPNRCVTAVTDTHHSHLSECRVPFRIQPFRLLNNLARCHVCEKNTVRNSTCPDTPEHGGDLGRCSRPCCAMKIAFRAAPSTPEGRAGTYKLARSSSDVHDRVACCCFAVGRLGRRAVHGGRQHLSCSMRFEDTKTVQRRLLA